MPITIEILKKFPNNWFVETGTHMGTTVRRALDCGFSNIISIEVSKALYEHSCARFKDTKNVKLIYGDSGLILFEQIKNINEPITFWLDGHNSKNTGKGVKSSPLIEELQQIKKHHVDRHSILIDDVRSFGYHNIDLKAVKNLLKSINENYKINFIDSPIKRKDIIIASL